MSGTGAPPNIRTSVYIDGFNLYKGSLEGTRYRWLDLNLLSKSLLSPGTPLVSIKYFTARIKPKSSTDPNSATRQDIYLRALESYLNGCVEIIMGTYRSDKVRMPLVKPVQCKRRYSWHWPWFINHSCHPEHNIQIWKHEEKKTDVNLAVHLVNDAWLDLYDQAIVISNDTDLEEAMNIARTDHSPSKTGKRIGIITPTTKNNRHPAKTLINIADWHKEIKESHLQQSLLPQIIPNSTIYCPPEWT